MNAFLRLLVSGAALGAATLGWATGVERQWYALRHVTVPVLRPAARRPLRILHVSDLHLLPGQARLPTFLDQCLSTGPDLVVATGDLIGDPHMIDPAVELLAHVRGNRPGLVVLGSNDLYASHPRNPLDYLLAPARRRVGRRLATHRLADGLRVTGWDLIDNHRSTVDTPAGILDVVGLGDPHIGRDRPERIDWRPWPSGRAAPALRLGVVHAPYLRTLDRFDREAFDLVLAGHTHGGQVRLPGVGALAANCDLPLDQARGVSRHGGALWLHVSAGLGHSRYAPYRLACRPEATVLDLVHAPPPGQSAD
ncbi:MAG: metallophosphoesterase [Nitriliruptorales bacterium]|nr:metallophosphoesterase [Nitriliruptorales bacterium]